MAIRAILILGAFMLGCGSLGLLLVRCTSPLLRGLGYLGAAYAAGSAGAWLLLGAAGWHPLLATVLADMCVLGSFVLLHVALLELLESESLWPIFGLCLLAAQAAADVMIFAFNGTARVRAIVAGLLIAAQAIQTFLYILPRSKQGLRLPAIFVSGLLGVISVANAWRSFALILGYFRDEASFYLVAACTFALFIAIALGLGFGVFWMAATALTAGLEHMASTDPLTRTFNRRVFLRWCDKERERHEISGAIFSVLMIDFDHFKAINDNYGHHVGDEVLCMAVEHMQNAIRGIDVLGRWGGEEFAVLLPGASVDSASLVAERLRVNVSRMRMPEPAGKVKCADAMIKMTVSVGVATFASGGEDTLQQMLKRADTALYEAKAQGRNRVVVGSIPVYQPWATAASAT